MGFTFGGRISKIHLGGMKKTKAPPPESGQHRNRIRIGGGRIWVWWKRGRRRVGGKELWRTRLRSDGVDVSEGGF